MEKGISNNTRFVLDYLAKEKLAEIDIYISRVLQEKSKKFQDKDEITKYFAEFIALFYARTTEDERAKIVSYTGLDFRRVNQILRGYWDYEKNGVLTPEIKEYANNLADGLRKILLKAPILPFNMKVYRGVGIPNFYSYNITKLSDLEYMKDKFMYESAFTSTSMLESSSFYSKQPEWGDNCNIEIEYFIPAESEDGVALLDNSTSYSPNQFEFLINSSSLFKVIDVEIDNTKQKAKLKAVLIPEKIWNTLDYEMERSENKLP